MRFGGGESCQNSSGSSEVVHKLIKEIRIGCSSSIDL